MSEAVITQFYEAFSRKDAQKMAECYHPEIHFCDPVFPDLNGFEAAAMWKMLCLRGKDLELTFSQVKADGDRGSAHWEAHYTFSKTGNKVHNKIDATFVFKDGKIVDHQDRFNFYAWAGQALGVKGKLLGWLPPVKKAVQAQAAEGLKTFIEKEDLKHSDFFP